MVRFDLFQQDEVIIYTFDNSQKLRSEIDQFQKEYKMRAASCQIKFEQLILSEQLS